MATISREFKESPLKQSPNEEIAYALTTTPWSSSPTVPKCYVHVNSTSKADSNLTSTSVCTISGDVLTTGLVQNLVDGANYKMRIQWKSGTTIFEAYGEIECDL